MSEETLAPGQVKSGKRTTEFLLLLGVAVLAGLTSTGLFTPENCGFDWCPFALQALGLLGAVAAALGYGVIRKGTKADAQKSAAHVAATAAAAAANQLGK